MDDLERTIQELECCISEDCDNCSHMTPCDDGTYLCARVDLLKAVVALLEAQLPRVLTLEDASKRDMCWLEWRRRGRKPVACRVIIRGNRIGDKVLWVHRFFEEPSVYSMSKYGKDWRCWTSRPTDEQRKAVKWG